MDLIFCTPLRSIWQRDPHESWSTNLCESGFAVFSDFQNSHGNPHLVKFIQLSNAPLDHQILYRCHGPAGDLHI